jgi:hypothetical protein
MPPQVYGLMIAITTMLLPLKEARLTFLPVEEVNVKLRALKLASTGMKVLALDQISPMNINIVNKHKIIPIAFSFFTMDQLLSYRALVKK